MTLVGDAGFGCSFRCQLSVLFLVLIFSIGSGVLFYLGYQQHEVIKTNLNSQGQAISHLVSEDIARLVFLDDPDVAASITVRINKIPEIQSATFFDTTNRPIISIGPGASRQAGEDLIEITIPINYESVGLGRADYLFHSPELIRLKKEAQTIFIGLIVVVLFLGFSFVLFIDHRFIARLSSLSDALRKVREDRDFSVRLESDRNDEIGLAMRNFNDLVGTVEKQTIDLIHQAWHDNLTGLYNRNRLMSQLERMIDHPPINFHHAVCFMDLDRFKVVNDTCGHAAGDELLRRLADILLDTLQGYSGVTLGRIGGDEFLILFDDKNEQQVRAVMRHISKVIGGFRFRFLERDFSIGVSFGCILFNQEDTSASELLSAADAACYQVKHDGGNLVQLYHLHDQSLLDHQRSMDWVGRLYSAIDENHFRLYLQPIVAVDDVENRALNHFETLIRLNQDGKVISPFLFIPVAERYGLIKKIDLWVFENVCSRLIANPRFLDNLELISINLSGLTVSSQDVVRQIDKVLLRYPVPYNKLCFEITETGVISEIELAQQFIRYFGNRGIRFALDDFGSGMASFGYLSQLDVDFLKIDGSFIRNMENDRISMEMVETMVNIGRITRKQVVAEQVENQQVVDLLGRVGVDFMQGYHFGRPEPIDHFLDVFSGQSANGGN